jgi:hypothetical protein
MPVAVPLFNLTIIARMYQHTDVMAQNGLTANPILVDVCSIISSVNAGPTLSPGG